MKHDAKQDQRAERGDSPAGNERTLNGNRAEQERRGNWFFRCTAPLVAGLALLVAPATNSGCADNATHSTDVEEDADATQEDAETRVEDVREDVGEIPDVDVAEDAPGEAEDGEPDVIDADDTPDVGEDAVPEAGDVEDLPDLTDYLVDDAEPDSDIAAEGEAEADAYDCRETSRTDETPTVLPDSVCGSTQTVSDLDYIIEWVGADCESTGSTSTRVGKVLTLTPDVDTAGLDCIRTRTTSTPQGDETLVAATVTSLETATAVACADMMVGDNLDGGTGENKFRLTDVTPSEATGMVFDPTWRPIRNVSVYGTGNTAMSSTRGLIAAYFNASTATARVCIIELPTILRNNGDMETWASYGDFTFNTSVAGTRMQGWEWAL